MQQPLLTIAVTTYDRKELLIETISSILVQEMPDIEILVGNDNTGRTVDATYTGISDPRIRYINNPNNLGEWSNLQFLFRESKGVYFTSLADDDLYASGFLKTVANTIYEYNSPSCIYTSFTEYKDEFFQTCFDSPAAVEMTGKEFLDKYIRHELKAMGNCGFFKRDILEHLGGVVQWTTKSYADTWMTFYLAANIERIVYIDRPFIYFRDHSGSLSSSVLNLKEWMLSQNELLGRMDDLLNTTGQIKKEEYFYQLLSFWCVSSFYSRLLKLRTFNLPLVREYYSMIMNYSNRLGKYKLRFIKDVLKKTILFWPVRLVQRTK